jgi:hypothetical protein
LRPLTSHPQLFFYKGIIWVKGQGPLETDELFGILPGYQPFAQPGFSIGRIQLYGAAEKLVRLRHIALV